MPRAVNQNIDGHDVPSRCRFDLSRDLSPGVQRNILQYLAELAAQHPIAGLVHQILEQIFRD
jgi:hypothetical protein